MLENPTPEQLRMVDGLVAEYVYGWSWFSACSQSFLIPPFAQESIRNLRVHWTPGLKSKSLSGELHDCKKSYSIEYSYPTEYGYLALPKYSTDAAACFTLICTLVDSNIPFCPTHNDLSRCQTHEADNTPVIYWYVGKCIARTLQLAICLHALDCFKVPLPEELAKSIFPRPT